MILLDTTLSVDSLAHIGELLVLLATGFGFFFKMQNSVEILRNDLKNTEENIRKLEQKTSVDYAKIETKMQIIEERIESLPVAITNLIKAFLK